MLEVKKQLPNLSECFTLTVNFPALYCLSWSGSSAGRSGKSKPSTSAQSSARPSIVTIPGLKWAEIRASSSGSQVHSPDSWWEAAKTNRQPIRRWRRNNILSRVAWKFWFTEFPILTCLPLINLQIHLVPLFILLILLWYNLMLSAYTMALG